MKLFWLKITKAVPGREYSYDTAVFLGFMCGMRKWVCLTTEDTKKIHTEDAKKYKHHLHQTWECRRNPGK